MNIAIQSSYVPRDNNCPFGIAADTHQLAQYFGSKHYNVQVFTDHEEAPLVPHRDKYKIHELANTGVVFSTLMEAAGGMLRNRGIPRPDVTLYMDQWGIVSRDILPYIAGTACAKAMWIGSAQSLRSYPFNDVEDIWCIRNGIDHLITVSQHLKSEAQLLGFPASDVSYIPPPLDTETFKPVRDQNTKLRLRQELGLTGKQIFLYTGRLNESKGVPGIVEHFPEACTEDMQMVLVGGEDSFTTEKYLMAMALQNARLGDRLRYVPMIHDPKKLVKYYQAADWFLFPSIAEGLSKSMAEALACGLPLIVTREGLKNGLNELATAENALVMPDNDFPSYYDLLELINTQPGLQTVMGQAATSFIRTMGISTPEVGQQHLELYKELAARYRKRSRP